MERKIKGIALMLVGIFMLIIVCCFLILEMQFELFIAGLVASAIFLAIGLYLVFSNKDVDSAIKNYIDGKDE